MQDFSVYIPKVNFELIPINNLVSNQEYQRNISASHIRRMAEDFDLYQINPVKVSRRDGKNNVFNGQHTIETIAFVSGSRDTPVWCMVYSGLKYQEEAEIFANQQKHNRALSAFDTFKANIEAGNDAELLIKAAVEDYGYTISSKKMAGTMTAVGTLCYTFNNYGFEVLDRTLRLCFGAWEGDPNSLTANILKGIRQLVVAFGEELQDDLFKNKVGGTSIRELGRTAKERGGTFGYAEAMLLAYNSKMKSPLPQAALYIKKKPKKQEELECIFETEDE